MCQVAARFVNLGHGNELTPIRSRDGSAAPSSNVAAHFFRVSILGQMTVFLSYRIEAVNPKSPPRWPESSMGEAGVTWIETPDGRQHRKIERYIYESIQGRRQVQKRSRPHMGELLAAWSPPIGCNAVSSDSNRRSEHAAAPQQTLDITRLARFQRWPLRTDCQVTIPECPYEGTAIKVSTDRVWARPTSDPLYTKCDRCDEESRHSTDCTAVRLSRPRPHTRHNPCNGNGLQGLPFR